jgi:hypothetical protein
MKIESNHTKINASASKTFDLVSNCNNFGTSLPPEVEKWESTENTCSFEISGMAKINIEIIDKQLNKSVTFKATANQPIGMIIVGNIEDQGVSCNAFINLDADVPVALSMMVKKPLEKFVNVLMEKIKEVAEK